MNRQVSPPNDEKFEEITSTGKTAGESFRYKETNNSDPLDIEKLIGALRLSAAKVLENNIGNRLTAELANGIYAAAVQQPTEDLKNLLEAHGAAQSHSD